MTAVMLKRLTTLPGPVLTSWAGICIEEDVVAGAVVEGVVGMVVTALEGVTGVVGVVEVEGVVGVVVGVEDPVTETVAWQVEGATD
jgi:hypothetical protein